MKRLSLLLTLPLLLIAVLFTVANRESLNVGLWPFEYGVGLPVFVWILGSLFAGLLAGALIAWLSAGKLRRRARAAERRAADLERELFHLRDQSKGNDGAAKTRPGLPPSAPAPKIPSESRRLSSTGA